MVSALAEKTEMRMVCLPLRGSSVANPGSPLGGTFAGRCAHDGAAAMNGRPRNLRWFGAGEKIRWQATLRRCRE